MEALITARLPAELVQRLDALIPALAKNYTLRLSAGRASRSTALRMALEKGLPYLEAELADQPSTETPHAR
jgi:predicted DNA-binding protein